MIKLITKNNWDFALFEVGQDYIITVVFFNSMVDFSRSFKLTEVEKLLSFDQFRELSELIRNNYENYKEREVTPAITSVDSM